MSSSLHSAIGTVRRFSESTHLIPTPGVEVQRPKRFEPLVLRVWVVVYLLSVTFAIAVSIEIGLALSNASNGFEVPERNVFRLGQDKFLSPQFLTTFIPTVLIAPLALLWQETDWLIKWYQPYVVLAKGNAPATESLLLDYIALGKVFSLLNAVKHKHPIIFISTMTSIVSLIFQPLAGSVLQIRQIADTRETTVPSVKSVGLSPDILSLNAFVASAGFAEASVFNDLPDPPFIRGGWATADFKLPVNQVLNGTLSVQTTGVRTSSNCGNPISSTLSTTDASRFVINATSLDGCLGSVAFDPDTADQQYGVIPLPGCGPTTDLALSPVMFWYFHLRDDGYPEARSVFCHPTISVYNIIAVANLNNGSLANVSIVNDYTEPNNVTGQPLMSQAYNGVLFDTPSPNNSFSQARALAVKSGVPGAIFRFALQRTNGIGSVFADDNGFLNITQRVYTQHLSLSAKSIYFVPSNEGLLGEITSLRPKLTVEPLPAHALATVMFIMGFTGAIIHVINRKERRKLWLATQPGSIAAIVSLTSRSGFGELLLPYDDEDGITRKLSGLRFGLDPRTGAIVADDGTGEPIGPEDTKLGLLDRSVASRQLSASSSRFSGSASGLLYSPPFKSP